MFKKTNNFFFRFAFVICLVLLPSASFAYVPKSGNVTASVGPFISKTNYSPTKTSGAPQSFLGMGLLANGDLNDKGSLEVGIIYTPKIYFRDLENFSYSEKTDIVQINMGYRSWWLETVSAGLAFYSAYPLGESNIYHSDFAVGTEPDTSAHDTVEYGFDFSLQKEVWTSNNFTVLVDARYTYSVTNKPDEHGDHYGLLIAVKYDIERH